ncbi:hypothetical protein CW362_20205 [Streptomyces populi]|uniref:Uncharacterized protein n=1 Tax=Streptomyces populi TaxID=2058924 RepID=A0A2I0SMX1_9ACTN|nr:hypothetical protein CW362_20205 [Streptomyces populi]
MRAVAAEPAPGRLDEGEAALALGGCLADCRHVADDLVECLGVTTRGLSDLMQADQFNGLFCEPQRVEELVFGLIRSRQTQAPAVQHQFDLLRGGQEYQDDFLALRPLGLHSAL